jgi:redox-sensitive bicupin YhaK (pirin superfamily)
VRSVFDYNGLGRELSPFLLLDYVAPNHFAPGNEKRGGGAHPHKRFEKVTVVHQGELEHRDSSGGGGKMGPGDVQSATGIAHEEFQALDFTPFKTSPQFGKGAFGHTVAYVDRRKNDR